MTDNNLLAFHRIWAMWYISASPVILSHQTWFWPLEVFPSVLLWVSNCSTRSRNHYQIMACTLSAVLCECGWCDWLSVSVQGHSYLPNWVDWSCTQDWILVTTCFAVHRTLYYGPSSCTVGSNPQSHDLKWFAKILQTLWKYPAVLHNKMSNKIYLFFMSNLSASGLDGLSSVSSPIGSSVSSTGS